MKFYSVVENVEIKETEKATYFIVKSKGERGGIIAFPNEYKPELTDVIRSGDYVNKVFELVYYSYKSKQGDYKNCFRLVNILPCFPADI